jgi:hypothetical protein
LYSINYTGSSAYSNLFYLFILVSGLALNSEVVSGLAGNAEVVSGLALNTAPSGESKINNLLWNIYLTG